ncbi:FAD-dependent oxidoreductase [Actinocatenispora rupis]|uniref:3-oxosteroid 1-dehydrogenase n=1 Tax=Actinocatenispora rupis TaxID=519421 RepID=A0A8J3J451_9ACTN|nr:FAD-dependent oxidoreductase [Actinocatenispora rupis]GID09774.1 3-ketosteroid-delta-1-dehydrogenase [Actinocatenispora rupis]
MAGTERRSGYDVVVVGSGGGGLTAALTAALRGLSAVVVEKTDVYGGTTALSGGALWIPDNHLLHAAGVPDSYERARRYLDATVGDRVPRERTDAYLRRGPEMLRFLAERTEWLRFAYVPGYPDYYPERPGGMPEGRSVEAELIDGRLLGPDRAALRPPSIDTKGFAMSAAEFHDVTMVTRTWRGRARSLTLGARLVRARATGYDPLTLGQALVARLRLALRDADVPVLLGTELVELTTDERAHVTGVRVRDRHGARTITARRGVILAAGGFSRSAPMRDEYLPHPTDVAWTSAPEGQTGDAIRLGVGLGAAADLMDRVWGAPSLLPPGAAPFFLVSDRGIPNLIVVDAGGERYLNESLPYHEFVDRMYAAGAVPYSWAVFDRRAKNRYVVAGTFPRQPFPARWYESGFVRTGRSIADLADRIDVPAATLRRTIARYNDLARAGRDTDFGRGDSAYDRYYGDPTLHNPNLLPLTTPPLYAVRVYPGDIGTKGGLVTDPDGRVLRPNGTPIAGLYATGNTSAAVMGETYPGPGATIGPAMVFGYAAAQDL